MGCWVISGWFVHRRSVGAVDVVGVVGAVGAVDAVDVVGVAGVVGAVDVVDAIDAVGTVDVVDVVVRRSSAASPVQPAACAAGLNQTASIPPESPAFQSICPRHNIKIHSDCPRNQMLPQHRNTSIILRPQTIFKRGNMYACSSAARSLTLCIPILRLRPVSHAVCPYTSTSPGLSRGVSPYFRAARSFPRRLSILRPHPGSLRSPTSGLSEGMPASPPQGKACWPSPVFRLRAKQTHPVGNKPAAMPQA